MSREVKNKQAVHGDITNSPFYFFLYSFSSIFVIRIMIDTHAIEARWARLIWQMQNYS